MKLLFVLLIIYQFKHFLADYILQGEYMLGKFKPGWGFIRPLLAHVSVHAIFTFIIASFFVSLPAAILLGVGDATIHFIMDRIKAGPKYLGRFKPLTLNEYTASKLDDTKDRIHGNVLFWWSLGLDQMVHHLTHYVIIYLIFCFR